MTGRYDGVIADGAVRSGKTVAMVAAFLAWSLGTFRGRDFIVAGQSVGAVTRNVVGPMKQILREDFGLGYKHNRGDGTLTVRDNVYRIFGGHDERSQDAVQGMTAAGMLLDECALMPRSFIEQCTARCSVDGSMYFFNCNPANPANFVKAELIDKAAEKRLKYLHFVMDDNPVLSDEYKERAARQYSGIFRRRYILGEWCQAEGLVYQDFADGELETDCTATKADRCWVSVDYGISNPFVALLWTVRDGVAYCCDEYSHDGRKSGRLTDQEHYDRMREMIAGRYVDGIVVDPSATSFIETVLRSGEYRVDGADNHVNEGIANVSTAMSTGCLRISKRCKTLLQELGEYRWDERAKADRVVKENDHACDAMRYFVQTIGRRTLSCFY